ncbi:MAG TPA: type II toxin-antitoxin system PemK/MazF family toxin [Candidatus Wujingus californicus]|uniref:type II toxin-antitoxin system PemK/MazF family toxin n=1 Tax=Candidatus Wujingus californicus TaxID=3367618 RepID=UPI001DD5ACAD|nr:type II toxin-antitoxin system PemK/MazF family toxin [Planctomycetota bacterium]MDO8094875.1 type II toxin-antitoxin system PemK/MazF family toxin [Candidatus Brocadiales bacterium]MDO8130507.1 type II toxin-antitoxin system PemK/MazF family toxin [Candidatus Brocadiales bacterium]
MTTYNKGDIVLVPFPFSDQTATKKRPAVIISSDRYNNTSSDIVIMAITSKTDKNLTTGECLINNWQDAGLLKPSVIKPAISTIEQTLVLKKLGQLSQKDLILMENTLVEFLDLREMKTKIVK